MTYKEKLGEAVVKTASEIYAFVANLPANTGTLDGDDPTITVEYYKDDAEFHVEYFFHQDDAADRIVWYAGSDFLNYEGKEPTPHNVYSIVATLSRDFLIDDEETEDEQA